MKTNILSSAVVVLASALITACASKPKSIVAIDMSANAGQELAQTRRDLDYERSNQLGLLSPENFRHAELKLEDAENSLAKNRSSQKVFEDLSLARGWLDDARQVGQRSRVLMAQPLNARANALSVFDPNSTEIVKADKELMQQSGRFEDGKTVSDRNISKISMDYMNAERDRIMRTQIKPIEARLKQAKSIDAKKWAPRTFEQASQDLDAAKATMKIEPYDRGQVASRISTANASSSDLLEITSEVAGTQGRTNEQMAIDSRIRAKEERRRAEAAAEEQRLKDEEAKKDYQSARDVAEDTYEENRKLKGELNEMKATAQPQIVLQKLQKAIPAKDAEVLMGADGKIMVRVKDLNFKTNSADLSPAAAAKLSKVRSALAEINPHKILVEGHTDSIGSAEKNQTLSETRAETVASVLQSSDTLKESQIETKGLGSEKPIKDNATKKGRAENRRVDITIDTL